MMEPGAKEPVNAEKKRTRVSGTLESDAHKEGTTLERQA